MLLRRVAVGGMAEVYVGRTKGIGGFEKLVAIKVIHPRFSEDDHFIQMLVEEAKISVQLNHVNIAQTFDLGCIDDTYYIAMEFIEGADCYRIGKRARDRKVVLPVDICCYLASEILNGLGYAHRKRDPSGVPMGIVHRDISPQNVLVSYSGEVKLVDFGIAKAASRGGQTEVGVIKGKYYYMSPEQAWGDHVDQRTDIFATGLLLYELLTGEMVYQQDNIPQLLDSVRKAEVPSPRAKRPEVPEELAQLIAKATAKEMEDRFESAQAFSQELSRFLYSRNPTFTASKLAQLMGTLFPEEVKRHSQVLRLPTAEEEAAHAKAKPAPRPPPPPSEDVDLPPMQPGELSPSAHENSVIFDLDAIEDMTRNDILPFRKSKNPPAERPTRQIAPPSRRNPRERDPWDEETLLRGEGQWEESTSVEDGVGALGGIQRGFAPANGAPPGDLESERTVAMASFPELMDGGAAPPSRPPTKSFPPPGRPPTARRPIPPPASRPAPPPPSSGLGARPIEADDADEATIALGGPTAPAELRSEKTMAFTESAPTAPLPRRAGSISQPSARGVRLGPEAARFFEQQQAAGLVDPFAPVGAPPEPSPGPAPPGHDPFMARLPPELPGNEDDLGKPRPLRWIALGLGALLGLVLVGAGLAVVLSGPRATSLEIISVPEGATVRFAERDLTGTTPITVENLQPEQVVSIEIRHAGYEPHRASFRVVAGQNRRVFLLNQIRATLHIETDPPGAQVWIDDELRGTAPIDVSGLPAGRVVRLRASAPGRGEMRREVTIDPEDRAPTVRLELPPPD